MFELFMMGGPLFMGLITLAFLGALVLAVRAFRYISSEGATPVRNQMLVGNVRSMGLLALVLGVLGQMIGLFSAFEAMEQMNSGISPALLAGGLKVSSITTLWGLICYVVSLIIAQILGMWSNSGAADQ